MKFVTVATSNSTQAVGESATSHTMCYIGDGRCFRMGGWGCTLVKTDIHCYFNIPFKCNVHVLVPLLIKTASLAPPFPSPMMCYESQWLQIFATYIIIIEVYILYILYYNYILYIDIYICIYVLPILVGTGRARSVLYALTDQYCAKF